MMSLLYPISYLVSLSGLIGWFYFQDKRSMSNLMSKLFLGGFLAYLVSLGLAEGELSYKLFVLFRDLIVLGLVSQFFNFFRRFQLLFFGLLFALYGWVSYKGFSILENTFPQMLYKLDPGGELLIELKNGHRIQELQSVLEQYGISYERAFYPQRANQTDLDDYYVLNIPDVQTFHLEKIEKALYETKLIDWAEENEEVAIDPVETPRPIAHRKSYGINDPGVELLWGFEAMGIDKLYEHLNKKNLRPKKKALIAVLDTGIDAEHEDIAGNYHSFQSKYDSDSRGHGTHCAGIAGAVSNNKKGVASFSLENEFVQVGSIKVLSNFGIGTQKGIIDGMIEAADNGADVISMSLGGRANPLKQRAYEKAVKYANEAGAIVVVAAGNSNDNAKNYAPANAKGVITVSAIDENLNRAVFSNFNTDIEMGIAAPGVNIYSTFPGNQYQTFNGTSMATPYVSGLVGLMKSIRPDITTSEVHEILIRNGKDTKATMETGRLIQPAEVVKALN